MNDSDDKLKLRKDLRAGYRRAEVSPFMAARVIANVNKKTGKRFSFFKMGSGLAIALLLVFVISNNKQNNAEPDVARASLALSFNPSRIVSNHSAFRSVKIPAWSAVQGRPSLNQFSRPESSLYEPGELCIYKQKGEMKC